MSLTGSLFLGNWNHKLDGGEGLGTRLADRQDLLVVYLQ